MTALGKRSSAAAKTTICYMIHVQRFENVKLETCPTQFTRFKSRICCADIGKMLMLAFKHTLSTIRP